MNIAIAVMLLATITTQETRATAITTQDNDDYRKFCTEIANSFSPKKAKVHLDAVLNRLQHEDILSRSHPFETAEDICSEPDEYSNRVCVFLRKVRMLQKMTQEYHKVGALDFQKYHARMWCKHPECQKFKLPMCKFVLRYISFLPGYVDCSVNQATCAIKRPNSVELRKEVHQFCSKGHPPSTFCMIKIYFDTIDKCKLKSKMSYFLTGDEFNDAIKLNYFAMKENDPQNFKNELVDEKVRITLYMNTLNVFFTLASTQRFKELFMYVALLPDSIEMNKQCVEKKVTYSFHCFLVYLIDQVQNFHGVITRKRKKTRKIIFAQVDFKRFLRQSLRELYTDKGNSAGITIDAAVMRFKEQYRQPANQRFRDIISYFRKIRKVNIQIIKAEVKYLKTSVLDYALKVESLFKKITFGLKKLLTLTMNSPSADVVKATSKVSAILVGVWNPLLVMLGYGECKEGEIMKSATQLADALDGGDPESKLRKVFDSLVKKTRILEQKAMDVLRVAKTIITKIHSKDIFDTEFEKQKYIFLQMAETFLPLLQERDMSDYVKYLEDLVQESCNVIDTTSRAEEVENKAVIDGVDLCSELPTAIGDLMIIYIKLYNYQFRMVDSLTSFLHAHTAHNTVDHIIRYFEAASGVDIKNVDIDFFLYKLVALSYVTKNIQTMNIIEVYCDILEYEGGGVRPQICEEESPNIKLLLAYKSQKCTDEKLKYVNIPSEEVDDGGPYIDLKKIFKGDDVMFQVPNNKWLVEHNWISKRHKNAAIYMKRFDVYLPIESETARKVKVMVETSGGNTLTNSKIAYDIIPPVKFEYYYIEGNNYNCPKKTVKNPYFLCPTNAPPNICPKYRKLNNEHHVRHLFPSVTANWKISVHGYSSNVKIPKLATEAPIKVGVLLCKMPAKKRAKDQTTNRMHRGNPSRDVASSEMSTDELKNVVNNRCCERTHYWVEEENSCFPCPVFSVHKLRGYYCEKN